MLQLPKILRDPKETEDLCKCRPICKSRRRVWKGQVQNTSAELLLERKLLPQCLKRWPRKISPNGPCPMQREGIILHGKYAVHKPQVVRICQAPVDDTVEMTYLKYTDMAIRLGAMGAVDVCCAFCHCGKCCACSSQGYKIHDADRTRQRRLDMRKFDARVKIDQHPMRIMYDKI